MPTYDYVCDACDHRFEEFQSMSEDALRKCPQCKKLKLRRLFGSGAAILFKGSGFYETDYRSDSYKQAAKADQDKTASSSDNGKSAGAGENAPGGKKEKKSTSGGKSPKSEG